MKILKYLLSLILTILLVSCSGDDDPIIDPIDEVTDLLKVQDFSNATHTVEMYSINGKLAQGYNNLTFRIKDKSTNEFVENASIEWTPMMHMVNKTHSCPKSSVVKVSGKKTIYNGYIIFQMPENQDEGWDLTINYEISGMDYEVKADISVPMSEKREVSVFTGADNVKYIVALVGPKNPEVKINDITLGLFRMENMMSFPVVKNYSINLDPRMPSMDNHSSPNNVNPVFNAGSNMYQGKLSLTMTGYWKLNLMLYNTNSELLKGEEVTVENVDSSLFLEIEF